MVAASIQPKFSCLYKGAEGTTIEAAEVCGHHRDEERATGHAWTLAGNWSQDGSGWRKNLLASQVLAATLLA